MWEPMAQALGYPKKQLGFERHPPARAVEPTGWAALRACRSSARSSSSTPTRTSRPPGCRRSSPSTTRRPARRRGCRRRHHRPAARATVKAIERSIVHYGDTTLFIADQLRKEGPGYASAVAMEEATLARLQPAPRQRQPKLVGDLPERGHVLLRRPLTSCSTRRGSRRRRSAAAQALPASSWPSEIDARQVAARTASARATSKAKPVRAVDAAHGVDPAQPQRVLGLPEPRVLAAAQADLARGPQARQRAARARHLGLDGRRATASSSAKRGLRAFLARGRAAGPRRADRVLSDQITPLVADRADRARTARGCSSVVARPVRRRRHARSTTRPPRASPRSRSSPTTSRINAVVVLTDGEDTDSDAAGRRRRRASSRAPGRLRAPACACSRSPTAPGAAGARRDAQADRRRPPAARPTRATPTTSSRSTARSPASSDRCPTRPTPYSREEFAGALVANAAAKPVQPRVARRDDRSRRCVGGRPVVPSR